MTRKWEYRVRLGDIGLPANYDLDHPMMESRHYEQRLAELDEEGWEFVGQITQRWNGGLTIHEWLVFRRALNGDEK